MLVEDEQSRRRRRRRSCLGPSFGHSFGPVSFLRLPSINRSPRSRPWMARMARVAQLRSQNPSQSQSQSQSPSTSTSRRRSWPQMPGPGPFWGPEMAKFSLAIVLATPPKNREVNKQKECRFCESDLWIIETANCKQCTHKVTMFKRWKGHSLKMLHSFWENVTWNTWFQVD